MREATLIMATIEHVKEMAPHLKAPDVAELQAMGAHDSEQALRDSLLRSVMAWTWMLHGKPVFMFGVAMNSFLSDTATPWGLGTDEACKYPKLFLRGSRKCFAQITRDFPHLQNYIDSRHASGIRWLQRIGFKVNTSEPMTVNNHQFYHFEVRQSWA